MTCSQILALGLAVTLACGGCSEMSDDEDPVDVSFGDKGDLAVGVAAAAAIGAVAIVRGAEGKPGAPKRTLEVVRGALADGEGRPIAGATLTVRAARGYTAKPEKLKAVTMQTDGEGRFVLPLDKADALCVDITAGGKRPVRRWFVVLVPNATKSLPVNQEEITFVSPYAREAGLMRICMPPAP